MKHFSILLLTIAFFSCNLNNAVDLTALSSEWAKLSFTDFADTSYRYLLARNPKLVSELVLDAEFGFSGNKLTNISEEYIQETDAS